MITLENKKYELFQDPLTLIEPKYIFKGMFPSLKSHEFSSIK